MMALSGKSTTLETDWLQGCENLNAESHLLFDGFFSMGGFAGGFSNIHGAPLVVATVAAEAVTVGKRLLAAFTVHQLRNFDCRVAGTLTAAGFGLSALGNGHRYLPVEK